MKTWIWKPGAWGDNRKPDLKCCRASVMGQHSFHSNQCSRKAVVERTISGQDAGTYGFCRQHDPVFVEEKERKWREKFDADQAARQARYDAEDREEKAFQACKAALEQIAAGHNDPRSLAAEALALFDKDA